MDKYKKIYSENYYNRADMRMDIRNNVLFYKKIMRFSSRNRTIMPLKRNEAQQKFKKVVNLRLWNFHLYY